MLKYKETIFPNTASALSVQISKHCKKIQSRLHMYVKDYCYESSLISRTIYQFIVFTFRCFLRKQTLFQLSWWLDTMGFQNFYRGDIFPPEIQNAGVGMVKYQQSCTLPLDPLPCFQPHIWPVLDCFRIVQGRWRLCVSSPPQGFLSWDFLCHTQSLLHLLLSYFRCHWHPWHEAMEGGSSLSVFSAVSSIFSKHLFDVILPGSWYSKGSNTSYHYSFVNFLIILTC